MNNIELQRIKQRYNVVGNCDALNRALDIALQVAPTDLSVLIVGESGVGKRLYLVSFTIIRHEDERNILQLIADQSQKELLIANFSDTKKVRLQELLGKVMDILV